MSQTNVARVAGPTLDAPDRTLARTPGDADRLGLEAAVERMARQFCRAAGVEPEALAEAAPAWRAYQDWSRGMLTSLKSAAE